MSYKHNIPMIQAKFAEFSAGEISGFIKEFDEFDIDKSGDISVVELGILTKKIGIEMTVEQLKKAVIEVTNNSNKNNSNNSNNNNNNNNNNNSTQNNNGSVDIYDFIALIKRIKTGSDNSIFAEVYKKAIGFFNATTEELAKQLLETGFRVNLMTIGHQSVGKSTFISQLFRTDEFMSITPKEVILTSPSTDAEIEKIANDKSTNPIKLVESSFEINEGGLRGVITVADSVEMNHLMNNQNCWVSIVKYLTWKFDERIKMEREHVVLDDHLIHYCLYFIDAKQSGYLSLVDIEILSHIQDYVNIIPILSRCDGMNDAEIVSAKDKIKATLENNGINCFTFKAGDEIAHSTVFGINASVSRDLPSNPWELTNLEHVKETVKKAVIVQEKGLSTTQMLQDCVDMLTEGPIFAGKHRCRSYPWGYVDVSDKNQNGDFLLLRDLLLTRNRLQLAHVTLTEIYKKYRSKQLPSLLGGEKNTSEMQKTEAALQEAKKDAALLAKQLEDERQSLAKQKSDAMQEAKRAADENAALAKRLQELQRMMAESEQQQKQQQQQQEEADKKGKKKK